MWNTKILLSRCEGFLNWQYYLSLYCCNTLRLRIVHTLPPASAATVSLNYNTMFPPLLPLCHSSKELDSFMLCYNQHQHQTSNRWCFCRDSGVPPSKNKSWHNVRWIWITTQHWVGADLSCIISWWRDTKAIGGGLISYIRQSIETATTTFNNI